MKEIRLGLGILCSVAGLICVIYSMAGVDKNYLLCIGLACTSAGLFCIASANQKEEKKNQETPPESEENPVDKP